MKYKSLLALLLVPFMLTGCMQSKEPELTPEELEHQFKNLAEEEGEIRATLRKMIPIKIKSAMDAGEQLHKL